MLPAQPRAPIGTLLAEIARQARGDNVTFNERALAFIDADEKFWTRCYEALMTFARTGQTHSPLAFMFIQRTQNNMYSNLNSDDDTNDHIKLFLYTSMGQGVCESVPMCACDDMKRAHVGLGGFAWCTHNDRDHQWAAVLYALLANEAFRSDFFAHVLERERLTFTVAQKSDHYYEDRFAARGMQVRNACPASIMFKVQW